jgi:hypothetical protein
MYSVLVGSNFRLIREAVRVLIEPLLSRDRRGSVSLSKCDQMLSNL